MNKVYVGDTGTQLILDCGTSIVGSTTRSIEARKPDGSLVSWGATQEGSNSIKYVSEPSSFDQSGTWRLQAKVTMPSGIWLGQTVSLVVHPKFG